VKGAAALCNQAATVVGAITYGQKTICLKIAPLVEVRLKNAAGTYIQSTDSAATPQQIIPRKVLYSTVQYSTEQYNTVLHCRSAVLPLWSSALLLPLSLYLHCSAWSGRCVLLFPWEGA